MVNDQFMESNWYLVHVNTKAHVFCCSHETPFPLLLDYHLTTVQPLKQNLFPWYRNHLNGHALSERIQSLFSRLAWDEYLIFKWTRVRSNLWINDLHTSKGCDTKSFGSRTDAYLTLLDEIGLLSNIFNNSNWKFVYIFVCGTIFCGYR